jgi:hypothetical protein
MTRFDLSPAEEQMATRALDEFRRARRRRVTEAGTEGFSDLWWQLSREEQLDLSRVMRLLVKRRGLL